MKRFARLFLIATSLLLVQQQTALAHMRDTLFNESYYTAKKREFEVELRNDYNIPDTEEDDTHNFKGQVEFEYGITNHLQVAYYEVFTWAHDGDWDRDAFKVETKYRLFEPGTLPVNIALYAEYVNPDGSNNVNSDEMELKLIFSRDFGPLNLIANLTTEREINQHEDWQWEYTAGANYAVNNRVRLGLEVKENLGDQGEFDVHRKGHELQLMPVVAATLTRPELSEEGKRSHPDVRLLFGPAIGLSRAADDLQLRSILEIEF